MLASTAFTTVNPERRQLAQQSKVVDRIGSEALGLALPPPEDQPSNPKKPRSRSVRFLMNAPLGFLPEARRKGIISKEVDGELLIYDLDRDKAHCLNLTAALVWRNSDGLRSIRELTRVVSRELDATIDDVVIQLAIKQLDRDHLLEDSNAGTQLPTDLSRRAVVRRLGVAAVLLPLITSISAPTALANVSCNNAPCVPNTPNNSGCAPGCTCSELTSTCVTI